MIVDLRLIVAVLHRFKRQVLGGVLIAVLLSALAYGTPTISHGSPTLAPHSPDVWQSEAELLITQASFPYGHASPQYLAGSGKTPAVPVGEEGYMSSLAPVYATLANGDAVQRLLGATPDSRSSVKAAEVFDTGTGAPTPFITLTASAPTSAAARRLAARAVGVLEHFVSAQQAKAGIVPAQRVELQVVRDGEPAKLVEGQKLTLPILVGLIVLALTVALAFVRENLDPRMAAVLRAVPATVAAASGGLTRSGNGHRRSEEGAEAIAAGSRAGGGEPPAGAAALGT